MSEQAINIRISLKDDITTNLKKATANIKQFGMEMRKVGREMSYVGMSMTAWGTAITAPLIVAYKQAGKFNSEIAHQLRQTQNTFDNLSVSIGKALLPIMRKLTDEISKAVDWWNSLDQTIRDRLIQNIFKLGAGLIALGTAFFVVGKALTFTSQLILLSSALLALNPIILAIASAFAILIVCMWKFKPVADVVINSLVILGAVAGQTADYFLILWNAMKFDFSAIKRDWQDISTYSSIIQNALSGKSVEAEGFNNLKEEITSVLKLINDLKNSTGGKSENGVGGFWSAFEVAVDEAYDNMIKLRDMGTQVANDLTTALSTSFSNFINDAFTGQLKRAQDYFAEFGKALVNIFAKSIAQMAADWIMFQVKVLGKQLIGNIMNLLGSFNSYGSGSATGAHESVHADSFSTGGTRTVTVTPVYHSGGIIRAHKGLAIDEVPIIAQKGERVLSREQNKAYESGSGQTVNYYIYAMDASSFAQMLYKNKNSIHGIVSSGMKQNTSMRGAVKTYG